MSNPKLSKFGATAIGELYMNNPSLIQFKEGYVFYRLSPLGEEIVSEILEKISKIFKKKLIAKWDKYCSGYNPGFRIKMEFDNNLEFKSNPLTRFQIYIDSDNKIHFSLPKEFTQEHIYYRKLHKLKNEFFQDVEV